MFSSVTDLPSTTSAAGVSTRLVRQLRRYYVRVRLLTSFPPRLALLASRRGPAARSAHWIPVRSLGSRACSFPTCVRLLDYAGPEQNSRYRFAQCGLPLRPLGRRPECVFRSSIPRPSVPLSTLHPAPHGTQRKTRGQDGSLLLSCGALSSPTARRFYPDAFVAVGMAVTSHPPHRPVLAGTTAYGSYLGLDAVGIWRRSEHPDTRAEPEERVASGRRSGPA